MGEGARLDVLEVGLGQGHHVVSKWAAHQSADAHTGFLAQFTRAQSATPRVFSSPFLVVTEISQRPLRPVCSRRPPVCPLHGFVCGWLDAARESHGVATRRRCRCRSPLLQGVDHGGPCATARVSCRPHARQGRASGQVLFSRVADGRAAWFAKEGRLGSHSWSGLRQDTGQLRFVVQMPVYGLPDGLDGRRASGWNAGGGRQGMKNHTNNLLRITRGRTHLEAQAVGQAGVTTPAFGRCDW